MSNSGWFRAQTDGDGGGAADAGGGATAAGGGTETRSDSETVPETDARQAEHLLSQRAGQHVQVNYCYSVSLATVE